MSWKRVPSRWVAPVGPAVSVNALASWTLDFDQRC